MKNPNSFGQLLGTSTFMVLALSFAAFNIQAAEKGAAFGTNFLNQPKPVARIAESPRVIQLPTKLALARVKGYAINSATVTSTAPTATISASASTVEANTSFTITVSGTSASGLSSLWWFVEDTANRTFHEISGSVNGESKNLSAAQDFSAGYGSESYSYTRTVKISNPGVYEFISNSRDRLYPVPGEPHQASEGAGMGRQTITVTAAQTGQCAGPGLAADVYGGPNHICCTGLVLQGGLCNVPPTTSNTCVAPYHGLTPDGRCVWSCSVGTEPSNVAPYECVCRLGFTETSTDQFGRRVCTKPGGPTEGDHPSEVNNHTEIIVCHKAGPENYVEIKTDKNGWLNGHSQHEGDYIKTGPRPCRPPKITVEPLSSETGSLTKNIEDPKDALIRKLQERIQRLEIRLSQVEQEVIEREKNRETKVDTTLTKRVSGKLLLQTEEHGEVWYVDPTTQNKFFLKDGDSAYQALRAFGTGISNKDFGRLKDPNFVKPLKGKILLQVESHGEAYYIDDQGQSHYLKDGAAAYEVMKDEALGISNEDLSKVPTASLAQEETDTSE